MKKVDLGKSVYELTEEYPELIEILKDMGFFGVINPIVRKTIGRKTTIPDGCRKQGKDLTDVIQKLKEDGFDVLSSTGSIKVKTATSDN
ncbi:MAG: DUF1858 domain-containing protein [Actinobacteria bacterium]|nr:DUF1858 domain-containing protein [Actinomycetota bacterium]